MIICISIPQAYGHICISEDLDQLKIPQTKFSRLFSRLNYPWAEQVSEIPSWYAAGIYLQRCNQRSLPSIAAGTRGLLLASCTMGRGQRE